MKIDNLEVRNDGYVHCKSKFYSAHDVLFNHSYYAFSKGTNMLTGDIDSGNWAISYLISMYKYRPKDFALFEQPEIKVNKKLISLNDFSEFSCYLDSIYPLFSVNKSVKKLVMHGLDHYQLNYSCEEIRNIFHIDSERFEHNINGVGNELFRAMAAIGFSHNKQVFCFPWLSKMRFQNYHKNLTGLLEILEQLEKIVVLPIGK